MSDEPCAWTDDEVEDMLLQQIRATAKYWAELPDVDAATGREHDNLSRCEGVAFSILAILDGTGVALPAFILKPDPHPEDKEFHREQGENWFDPDTEIRTMLHEHFHQ